MATKKIKQSDKTQQAKGAVPKNATNRQSKSNRTETPGGEHIAPLMALGYTKEDALLILRTFTGVEITDLLDEDGIVRLDTSVDRAELRLKRQILERYNYTYNFQLGFWTKNKTSQAASKKQALPKTSEEANKNKQRTRQRAKQRRRLLILRRLTRLVKGAIILVLWIAAIAFVVGGSYGIYSLYQEVQLVNEELVRQKNELAELSQQRLAERLNETSRQLSSLRDEYLSLNRQLTLQENVNRLLNTRLGALEEEIPLIDIESLEQQRLRELVYLAEQHRQLGESPYPIIKLLQQAYSIALVHSESLSLIEAINLDLARYQTISTINKTRALIELDRLLELAPQLPRLVESDQAEEPSPNDYLAGLKDVLASLGDYIRIYRIEDSAKFSLTEEEARLLELALLIRIMQAQSAVLQGEEDFYYHAIESANELVQDYYPSSSIKSRLIARLSRLAAMTIKPEPLPPLHSAALLVR